MQSHKTEQASRVAQVELQKWDNCWNDT